MSVYSISPTDGRLSFLEVFPAGGSWARQFAMNRGGNLVAVGLQETGSVSILERDTTSGILKKEVASIPIGDGQVTCVVWDE
jgi:6-phosphogluconolactonase (cycloisomerase 2 family)